ncbi:MAG: lysozyme inhibitor LprI family protein [Runella sp.]
MKKLLFILLVFPTCIYAQTEHPIEKALNDCMDKNPTTVGMLGCVETAYKQWDTELNKNYKALTQRLNSEQKTVLLASQRKWIEYRDLEFKTQAAIYKSMDGTMYVPMAAHDRMEIVKQRALELGGYLQLFDMK